MTNYYRRAIDAINRGRRFATHDVWHIGRPGEEIPHGFIIKQVRVSIVLLQNLVQDALLLRAAALTFATIFAIVPFLAITIFVMQTFHIDQELYRQVSQRLEVQLDAKLALPDSEADGGDDLGEDSAIQDLKRVVLRLYSQAIGESEDEKPKNGGAQDEKLINPVEFIFDYALSGSKIESIGLAGLMFVVVAVFGFMMNIESSFNTIWGLKRSRSWYRMFSDYLAVLLIMPFIVITVVALAAALESDNIRARLGPFAFTLIVILYAIIWLAFTALYFIVPNTKVKFRYALLAGIIAGTLWCLLTAGYLKFQFGLPRYQTLYSTLASVPILLMWVYVSWVILLFGAELSFAYQNEKTFAMERLGQGASYAYREALALRTMIEISKHFEQGIPGVSIQQSAEQWNVPTRLLNDTMDCLEDANLVTACATEPVTYQPARPPEKTTVGDIISALRESGREPSLLREDEACGNLFKELSAMDSDFHKTTIVNICEQSVPELPLADELPEDSTTA